VRRTCDQQVMAISEPRHNSPTGFIDTSVGRFASFRKSSLNRDIVPVLHNYLFTGVSHYFVRQYQNRVSQTFREIESSQSEFVCFLGGIGRQYYAFVVPMRSPSGLHEVSLGCLCGLSCARPCPLDIDNDTGRFSHHSITDVLLHQAETWP